MKNESDNDELNRGVNMKFLMLIAIISMALVACSKSELHEAMEDMGGSYKAMRKAETLEQMQAELDKFTASVDIAKQQQVNPDDQQTFDEGMKKLTDKIGKLSSAIEAGAMEDAKNALKDLRELKKELHEKLDVDDD